MQKKSKNFKFLKKNFFARNEPKRLMIRSQHHLCSPRKISARYLSKKKLVIFQEICDPGYAKKVKKLAIFEKFFFARNDLKRLKILSQHHLCSPRKFSGPYLSKKKLVIFQEICDPGYAKKVKRFQIFEKIFFRSKRAKTPYDSFATPFVQSTKNFSPVSLKKEVGHFSRNLWPRICKKSQKTGYLSKNFFLARNDPKRLKIRSQHHLCSPRQISSRYLSKKTLVIFQEICDPGYAKKVKKFQIFGKIFFARNNLKCLKICSQHHLWNLFDKFQAGISQKRSWSFFKKSVTPDMQKKSKKQVFKKNFFFPRNNLKCLKICSQHHLCSPQQISGRYFSKKKLVIFQEICDPGYAKKEKKTGNLWKFFFFPQNDLKRLEICSQHHLCNCGLISGRYLWKKKVVIFQEICVLGMQ